jgi:hypothetical protein
MAMEWDCCNKPLLALLYPLFQLPNLLKMTCKRVMEILTLPLLDQFATGLRLRSAPSFWNMLYPRISRG